MVGPILLRREAASVDPRALLMPVFQTSHPDFTWIAAEGKRSEDHQQEVAVILDFREETRAGQTAAYKKVDANGRPTDGQKRHAFTDLGSS